MGGSGGGGGGSRWVDGWRIQYKLKNELPN